MKILFYPSGFPPLHANLLEEGPLDSGPTSLIRLSEGLVKVGAEVTVLTEESDPPPSNPLYLPTSAFAQLGTFDVVVAAGGWLKLFLPLKTKKRVFWTTESSKDMSTFGIGDRRFIDSVDFVLVQTPWQAESLSASAGFPVSKMKILMHDIPETGNALQHADKVGWETIAREFLKSIGGVAK